MNMTQTTSVAKIVIVDDHPTVREGLAQLISRQADLQVCGEAEDVESAMSEIASCDPDVVVVDMGLKNSSGLDLIKRLHEERPDTAILAWSMHEASLFGKRALKAGALGYVSKTEPTERVINAIRGVLNRTFPVDDFAPPVNRPARGKLPTAGSVEDLSDRELQVLQMLGEGLNMTQMTARTQLSSKTIETYRARIKQKLDLSSHAELMRCAVQWTIERRTKSP